MKISAEGFDWLRLARSRNIGSRAFKHLIEVYGTASKAMAELPLLIERQAVSSRRWELCGVADVRRECDEIERAGHVLLNWNSDFFPMRLLRLFDPPPVLVCAGDYRVDFTKCIAVVGARNASANGYHLAMSIAEGLAQAGYMVVSGMARGIDRAAHEGCLRGDAPTVAFLAGGVDVVYPKENKDIYDQILRFGALYSEMPMSTYPGTRLFPRRNRLIAGVAEAVLVMECALKSGSMLTAKYAIDLGLDIFAVPGSPLDARYRGCNSLIKEGAELVETAEDIIYAMITHEPYVREDQHRLHSAQVPPTLGDIDEATKALKSALSDVPVSFDMLVETLQFPASVLRISLLEMEVNKQVIRNEGDNYCLKLLDIHLRQ